MPPKPGETERIFDRALDGYEVLTQRLDRVVESIQQLQATLNRNMIIMFVVFVFGLVARDVYFLKLEAPGFSIESHASAPVDIVED